MDLTQMYHKASISETTLIISNIIPIIGVLFFHWDIFTILFLYWSESAIIGFFNVIKMALALGISLKRNEAVAPMANAIQKIFMIPFFIIHYGGFMIVHLVFIIVLFGPISTMSNRDQIISTFLVVILGWLSLTISHGISFYTNYLQKKEYETATINGLMMQPYGRIIIMHLTIIFGAFILILTGGPAWVLALMVILKTGLDLRAHRKEHPLHT